MREIKESEQLVTHSMDEKASSISRTENRTVTNAALWDNLGTGEAPGNAQGGKCFVSANGE